MKTFERIPQKDMKTFAVARYCIDCGHMQVVVPVAVDLCDDGSMIEYHPYFGSAYDFCNHCDGPMTFANDEDEE